MSHCIREQDLSVVGCHVKQKDGDVRIRVFAAKSESMIRHGIFNRSISPMFTFKELV